MTGRPLHLPLIGAHIRQAGGLELVPQRAVDIGAEVVQIFNSNPRMWRSRPVPMEEMDAFTQGLRANRLPLFVHAIYLLNLASPDEHLRERSRAALAEALVMGGLAGAEGVVTHIGSHRGRGFADAVPWLVTAVNGALEAAGKEVARVRQAAYQAGARPSAALPAPDGSKPVRPTPLRLPPLLLENGVGGGGTMGSTLQELEDLLGSLPFHCGLCLDTAHLFASGYEVHTADGLNILIEDLNERALLGRVKLIHLNDSKTPLGSKRDRHENPGEGFIGLTGLGRVVRHPAFASIPFVLEVPGPEDRGPDATTLAIVKRMRGLG